MPREQEQVTEARYWLDERNGYVPLSEFPPFLLAIRSAGAPGWARQHPMEPTRDMKIRDVMGRLSGRPAYLCDDETREAAEAEVAPGRCYMMQPRQRRAK